ncbi:glucose uptake inhibitor SgrT [Shimwellia blattae]|nr:glucose uptake inhibitor SgrT [Shimwellia blattae]GAB81040.1 hypothetical protein EB105725_11_01220 [Shimwellia blattae DSM 4481 = NBRC 105725]
MKSAAMAFWKDYFVATHTANRSWLARLSVQQRLQTLDYLMQWELNGTEAAVSPAVKDNGEPAGSLCY